MNDTYLVTTRDERHIARLYRAGWRTPAEIAYELELLGHLAGNGVPVSTPIPGRDGRLIRELRAPEGARYLVLFTYAEGQAPNWEEEGHAHLAGRVAATIHAASDGFMSRYERFHLDLAYLIDRPMAAVRPFLNDRPEDLAYLEGLAGRLRARAEDAIRVGLDWGVCHGDLSSTGNFHLTENRRLTVFDFDLCGPGWRAYDLAAMLRAAVSHRRMTIWETFLRGYTEIRPLAASDLACVPLFHPICRLWSLGTRAANVTRWGSLFMQDWYIDSQLAFFRRWESEHASGS